MPIIPAVCFSIKNKVNLVFLIIFVAVYLLVQAALFILGLFRYGAFGHTKELSISIIEEILLYIWLFSPILLTVYFCIKISSLNRAKNLTNWSK